MVSTKEVIKNYVDIGHKKATTPTLKLLIFGIVAGVFIALAGVGANTAIATIQNLSVAKLVSAMIFPAGLAMVLCVTCNLFTGDNLIIISALEKKITFTQMFRAWVIVYIGNFIGSVIIAFLVNYTSQLSLFNDTLALLTLKIAIKKVSYSFPVALVLGILCNVLVCIAVLVAAATDKLSGKLIGLFFPILLFVVAGFEHCVANMYYIPAALFAKMNPEYVQLAMDNNISLEAFNNLNISSFLFSNLLPVTIGNIIGGALLVGATYWYLMLKED